MSSRLEVGYIARAHGLRGEVVVVLSTNRAERVARGAVLFAGERRLVVAGSRPQHERWIVAFEGVSDRDAADELRGSPLAAEPLDDPDELWVHELIGCRVVEADGTERGVVESVLANPASDLMVLDTGVLVPLTFVVEHTPGRIIVDTPPGLFDL